MSIVKDAGYVLKDLFWCGLFHIRDFLYVNLVLGFSSVSLVYSTFWCWTCVMNIYVNCLTCC